MAKKPAKPVIYVLQEPDTGAVRYVGQTKYPRRREWLHCSHSNNRRGARRVNKWILGLLERGSRPVFKVIEETPHLDDRERHWIAELRSRGADLLNMNDGGAERVQPSRENTRCGELGAHCGGSPKSTAARLWRARFYARD